MIKKTERWIGRLFGEHLLAALDPHWFHILHSLLIIAWRAGVPCEQLVAITEERNPDSGLRHAANPGLKS